jgi:hypothetical protein
MSIFKAVKMKKSCLALILFLAVSACQKDFLKEDNTAGVSYDYYNTPQGLIDGVTATYDQLRVFWGNGVDGARPELGINLSESGTDTWTEASYFTKALGFNRYTSFDDQDLQNNLYDMWQSCYKAINTCNIVIDRSVNVPFSQVLTSDLKKTKIAEAKFLRAINYFYLVQTFGKVPLLLQGNERAKNSFERADKESIYISIITDLLAAEKDLPSQSAMTAYGNASKGAAQHFLARVYLTRGSAVTDQRGQQPTDMDSAAYWADEVITKGPYKLVPSIEELWSVTKQINSELIFSVNYSANSRLNGNTVNGEGNQLHQFFLATYASQRGMKEDLANGRALGRLKPTDYLLDVFNRKSDSRFYKCFKMTFICNNGTDVNIPKWETGYTPTGKITGKPKYGNGDTAVLFSMYPLPVKTTDYNYRIKPYIWITRLNFTADKFPSLIKHMDPVRVDGTLDPKQARGSRDVVVARLAETYLIAAEAYARKKTPDYTKAVSYINEVRRRAAYKEGETRPGEVFTTEGEDVSRNRTSSIPEMTITENDINSRSKVIDFILDERARELCGELHRWYDLVREEKLVERVKAYNPFGAGVKSEYAVRPIPQLHLDLITNNGPGQQNTGY